MLLIRLCVTVFCFYLVKSEDSKLTLDDKDENSDSEVRCFQELRSLASSYEHSVKEIVKANSEIEGLKDRFNSQDEILEKILLKIEENNVKIVEPGKGNTQDDDSKTKICDSDSNIEGEKLFEVSEIHAIDANVAGENRKNETLETINIQELELEMNAILKRISNVYHVKSVKVQNYWFAKSETFKAKNCFELKEKGDTKSGIRKIYPYKDSPEIELKVFCNQHTDSGGWTVIQNRDNLPIRENFNRTWTEYSNGFGNLSGEFWLGLENIHILTNTEPEPSELRIDLENSEGDIKYAKYFSFIVGDSETKFRMERGVYSGNAGDSLQRMYTEKKFSTVDQLNEKHTFRGAWWASSGSNLNGFPHVGNYRLSSDTNDYSSRQVPQNSDGIVWSHWTGKWYSLVKARMMVRPKFSEY